MKGTHKSFILWHVVVALSYLCSRLVSGQALTGVKLVDMTHTFDNTTIYWVTEKRLTLDVTYNGTEPGGEYWYQKDEMSAATHGGTHLDAPCHFAKGRWAVNDIPLSHLVVPAAIVDISATVNSNSNVHLSVAHLTSWEKSHGPIPDGSLLLVRTGWSRFWPDPLTYSGTTERNPKLLKFPSIKPEVAEWLIVNRNIVGIGIDTMSIDIPNGKLKVHVTLNENNIYGLENVNFPEEVPPVGATAYVMPMKLRGASGAPCRLLLQIPLDQSNGGVDSSRSIVTILTAIFFLWLCYRTTL